MGEEGGSLFGNINKLREGGDDDEGREEREREQFNPDTLMGRIARHPHFEYLTLSVIMFNALYLGYDCDYNARWGKPDDLYASSLYGFMILDNFFCLYFTGEVVIRFLAYKKKSSGAKDRWFMFDVFLVTMMVIETWILAFLGPIDALKQVSILRLLRLARLFRMAKLMRYFPELQLIVKGMMAAVRSVSCAAVLMLLVLYVFGIIFTNEYHQGLKPDECPEDDEDCEGPTAAEGLFGSLPKSMKYLLIMGTILDDLTYCTNAIRQSEKVHMLMWFWACVLLCSFTLFNMLLGLLVEVVEATKDGEKKKAEAKELEETMVYFFKELDADGNGTITKQEFLGMRDNEHIADTLEKLEIQAEDFEKYASLLFAPARDDSSEEPVLHYEECVSMITKLRPGHEVNACDFMFFKMRMQKGNDDLMAALQEIEDVLTAHGALEQADGDSDSDLVRGFDEDDEQVGERPAMTNAKLARSSLAYVAFAPELASKWAAPPPPALMGNSMSPMAMPGQPGSPMGGARRSDSPPNPHAMKRAGDAIVNERVGVMVGKRRQTNNNLREQMYGDQINNMAYFQRSFALEGNQGNQQTAAALDNEGQHPFASNGFIH